MSIQTYLPEETIIKRGLEALMTALGPVRRRAFLTCRGSATATTSNGIGSGRPVWTRNAFSTRSSASQRVRLNHRL